MTATPETRPVDDQAHFFLAGLAQQGDYAFGFARAGRQAEALEHAAAIERLLAAYRLASGAWEPEAIHGHFELSYSNYLVLPRTLLQSMPDAWQARFVALVQELRDAFEQVPQADGYQVTTGKWMPLDDMTESQLHAAGIDVEGDDDLGAGPGTRYHRQSDGAELGRHDYGFVPRPDPVPHYNRGRTRIEPRPNGMTDTKEF
jgi:hypothetical protein